MDSNVWLVPKECPESGMAAAAWARHRSRLVRVGYVSERGWARIEIMGPRGQVQGREISTGTLDHFYRDAGLGASRVLV